MQEGKKDSSVKVITTTCNTHCGGTCLLKMHVKDGKIIRMETDDSEEPQLRACLRGRAYRHRIYAPDRLKFPLKRTGARGEGKFERISWDEALDTVAGKLRWARDTCGPQSILFVGGGGNLASLHTRVAVERLLSMMGGCTRAWGYHSFEGGVFASYATYGTMYDRNSRDDLLNSRLIIMLGWDPANTIGGTNTPWYLAQAREAGIRIISVDPRYTDSAATFAHQWLPIRPGTDAALLAAMAYVIISGNLQDRAFLEKYTVGFERFKDYVLGVADGIPKTPAWAEAITSVPAASIEGLAREYATTKPAALLCGIAPGRTAYGEQYHRMAITLAAMTGNTGVHGGDPAARVWSGGAGGYDFVRRSSRLEVPNPVDEKAPRRKDSLKIYRHSNSGAMVHRHQLADAILKGKGKYPADIKLFYIVSTSFPNQFPNINKAVRALRKVEFIVMHEQFMTPGAKFADILLPISSCFERNDITVGHGTPMFGFMKKVIEPLYECKSSFEIAAALAERLGLSGYSDKTEDEWLRDIMKETCLPDYAQFERDGFYKVKLPEPHLAFKKQIEDPEGHPFATPSGKIEIYSQELADWNNPLIPPVPQYIETWESYRDPLTSRYPLQLITTHFRRRSHSQFDNIPWLRALMPQMVTISKVDAAARGISDGEKVRVFNDRGEMIIPARVTERIMPGVVDIPQGAWYDPDEKGVDRGGSANVLTRDEPSPVGSFALNTALVQVEKVA